MTIKFNDKNQLAKTVGVSTDRTQPITDPNLQDPVDPTKHNTDPVKHSTLYYH